MGVRGTVADRRVHFNGSGGGCSCAVAVTAVDRYGAVRRCGTCRNTRETGKPAAARSDAASATNEHADVPVSEVTDNHDVSETLLL